MDPLRPFKVVKTPTALGVCVGVLGELLDEYGDESTAQAIMYETWIGDTSQGKNIYYTYNVVYWKMP